MSEIVDGACLNWGLSGGCVCLMLLHTRSLMGFELIELYVGGFFMWVSLFHSVPYEIIDGVCLNSAVGFCL